MKRYSNISLEKALELIKPFCPIKIYYNRKILWDDCLMVGEGWISLNSAIDNFKKACHAYKNILITDIKIKITDFHHSYIYLKGHIKNK